MRPSVPTPIPIPALAPLFNPLDELIGDGDGDGEPVLVCAGAVSVLVSAVSVFGPPPWVDL
jgi:hypothetical protein